MTIAARDQVRDSFMDAEKRFDQWNGASIVFQGRDWFVGTDGRALLAIADEGGERWPEEWTTKLGNQLADALSIEDTPLDVEQFKKFLGDPTFDEEVGCAEECCNGFFVDKAAARPCLLYGVKFDRNLLARALMHVSGDAHLRVVGDRVLVRGEDFAIVAMRMTHAPWDGELVEWPKAGR